MVLLPDLGILLQRTGRMARRVFGHSEIMGQAINRVLLGRVLGDVFRYLLVVFFHTGTYFRTSLLAERGSSYTATATATGMSLRCIPWY